MQQIYVSLSFKINLKVFIMIKNLTNFPGNKTENLYRPHSPMEKGMKFSFFKNLPFWSRKCAGLKSYGVLYSFLSSRIVFSIGITITPCNNQTDGQVIDLFIFFTKTHFFLPYFKVKMASWIWANEGRGLILSIGIWLDCFGGSQVIDRLIPPSCL